MTGILIISIILLSMLSMTPVHSLENSSWTRKCSVYIVAVSSGGYGVVGNLTVRVSYPGSGKVYISTSPASMIDTQGSARIAAFAASILAGVDMTNLDFYYDLSSNAIIVGGPSAGFAMALATLLALEGVNCTRSFAVTGMIQPDTSIGPVGGLKEKLEAASKAGAKIFIVPAGQEVYKYYKTVYKRIGPIVITSKVPVEVNLTSYGQQLGVVVKTASSLNEGFRIITGKSLVLDNFSMPQVDNRIKTLLRQYITKVNSRISIINSTIREWKSSYIRELMKNSTELLSSARKDYEKGYYYKSALESVKALTLAYTASYLDDAFTSDLDVTNIVEDLNQTLQNLYNTLENVDYENFSTWGLENLAKAWAKLGIASYYYKEALNNLEEEHGHYKLPSFLWSINTRGVEYLAESRSLSDWSSFWYNASMIYPGHTDPSRIRKVALLIESEARSTSAYLETLLQEAGAGGWKSELPLYLTEGAMSTSNYVAKLGLSIEAIALSTSAIHSTFTLEPNRTSNELVDLAGTVNSRMKEGSIQASLLLSYATNTNDVEEKLLSASKAVLYAWTTYLISGGQISHENPHPPAKTATMETIRKTTTPTLTNNKTTTVSENRIPTPKYTLSVALIAIIALITGVIVGSIVSKTGPG